MAKRFTTFMAASSGQALAVPAKPVLAGGAPPRPASSEPTVVAPPAPPAPTTADLQKAISARRK